MSRLALASIVLFSSALARAGNAPEGAQRSAEEDYLRKLDVACGTQLTVRYDGDSLRRLNKDVGYDQTGGSNECNEPLRYLWYACKSEQGKAAIKAAHLSKIVCKGTAAPRGALVVGGGVITVERAFEEDKPFLRSRAQFEAALKLRLELPEGSDPYYDAAWSDLRQQPNPVTDTKNYCLVNGAKIDLTENAEDSFHHRKEDATVKCWKDGELVSDLVLKAGRRSGFVTHWRDQTRWRESYRDDKLNGERRQTEGDKLATLAMYADGERVWEKTYHPSGKLASYWRQLKEGQAQLRVGEDGKVSSLTCYAGLRDDEELRRPCGYAGATTTSIYDGTGKVSRVVTYKDGVLAKEGAGDSHYARGSEVAYRNGKKHGEERILTPAGKLAKRIAWSDGVQDGNELHYAEDGQKIVEEQVWKKGELVQRTERYLNGNPKLREVYETPTRMQRTRYWDNGKVAEEGLLLLAEVGGYDYRTRTWREEGLHRRNYESGAHQAETSYHEGQLQGVYKSWWDNGQAESVEAYAKGRRTQGKAWDKNGKLVLDEEYEADGSRKLKR